MGRLRARREAGESVKPPVLVTGASRSGKSLVCRLLNESGEFELLREPRLVWNAANLARSHDRLLEEDLNPAMISRIREECLRLASEMRYLDNLAYHALHVPLVRAVFPDALIVHVVRHHREAVPEAMVFWRTRPPIGKSLRKSLAVRGRMFDVRRLWRFGRQFFGNYLGAMRHGVRTTCGPRVPGMESLADDLPLAGIVAWQWANLVRIAREDLEKMPRRQWTEVRHEDLLADPVGTIDELCRFLDITNSSAVIEAARQRVVPEGRPARREFISEEDWNVVEKIVLDVMGGVMEGGTQ